MKSNLSISNSRIEELWTAAKRHHAMASTMTVFPQELLALIQKIKDAQSAGESSVPAALRELSENLIGKLNEIHSALDQALGDTDVTHIEDDDELRVDHPVQWAAEQLAKVINELDETTSVSDDANAKR